MIIQNIIRNTDPGCLRQATKYSSQGILDSQSTELVMGTPPSLTRSASPDHSWVSVEYSPRLSIDDSLAERSPVSRSFSSSHPVGGDVRNADGYHTGFSDFRPSAIVIFGPSGLDHTPECIKLHTDPRNWIAPGKVL
jgi:hypothetical protein